MVSLAEPLAWLSVKMHFHRTTILTQLVMHPGHEAGPMA
jgi:hypothetical protein